MNRRLTTLALATLALTGAVQAQNYTVVNLGSLNGQSEAFAINDNGVAAGWTFTTTGYRQAVLFSGGQVRPLATPAHTNSIALGISPSGTAVGKLGTVAAAWTDPANYRLLGTLGGQESAARAMNANGVIVGSSQNGQYLWKPTQLQFPNGTQLQLGMLGGPQGAAAACSNGNIVGWSDLANGQTHATLWANGNTLDFGTLGGPVSQFLGSSEQGNACGWSMLIDRHNGPSNRGFVRRAVVNTASRTLRNLGEPYMARPYPTLFGGTYRGFVWTYFDRGVKKTANVVGVDVEATDLKGSGELVVGNATLYLYPAGTMKRAVAWVNGVFVDLTNAVATSGWTLQLAWGTNSKGQIVGQGISPNGGMMAYRLDPPAPNPSGLSFARFTGWTNSNATPQYANTTSSSVIPTVHLYVRKADGLVSNNPAGPFTSTSLMTWVMTDPARSNVRVKLSIDERGNPSSPNGLANWNAVCNSLQTAYSGFASGSDGSLRVLWAGSNMRNILNSFPNDSQLQSRWRFSTNGNVWLSIRLVVHKGPGY